MIAKNPESLRAFSTFFSFNSKDLITIEATDRLEGCARAIEAAILALRTRDGIESAGFAARFGRGVTDAIEDALRKIPPRLVSFNEGTASLTPAGMRVGNAIWTELLEL